MNAQPISRRIGRIRLGAVVSLAALIALGCDRPRPSPQPTAAPAPAASVVKATAVERLRSRAHDALTGRMDEAPPTRPAYVVWKRDEVADLGRQLDRLTVQLESLPASRRQQLQSRCQCLREQLCRLDRNVAALQHAPDSAWLEARSTVERAAVNARESLRSLREAIITPAS